MVDDLANKTISDLIAYSSGRKNQQMRQYQYHVTIAKEKCAIEKVKIF
jgi:hypothetical protein